jgi:hypothetical protein
LADQKRIDNDELVNLPSSRIQSNIEITEKMVTKLEKRASDRYVRSRKYAEKDFF